MNIVDVMNTALQFKVRGTMRNLHPTTMPLWSYIKGVQESKALAETTAQGRALLAAGDKDAFDDWKPRSLMSVYFAVHFRDVKGGTADAANVANYTGLAGYDFDGVDVASTMAKLRQIPQVVCAGVSASGRGVWCIAAVAAGTAAEYARCFAEGVRAFQATELSGLDLGAHDPTRARFAASSPECWWRWDAEDDIPAFQPVGDISLLRKPRKNGRKKLPLPEGYGALGPELAFDEMRQILNSADEVQDGDRNNEKARQCGELKALAKRAGVSPAVYAGPFIAKWDALGSTHRKTVSMVNRLLLRDDKK
jgi:hypothetical protein